MLAFVSYVESREVSSQSCGESGEGNVGWRYERQVGGELGGRMEQTGTELRTGEGCRESCDRDHKISSKLT